MGNTAHLTDGKKGGGKLRKRKILEGDAYKGEQGCFK